MEALLIIVIILGMAAVVWFFVFFEEIIEFFADVKDIVVGWCDDRRHDRETRDMVANERKARWVMREVVGGSGATGVLNTDATRRVVLTIVREHDGVTYGDALVMGRFDVTADTFEADLRLARVDADARCAVLNEGLSR